MSTANTGSKDPMDAVSVEISPSFEGSRPSSLGEKPLMSQLTARRYVKSNDLLKVLHEADLIPDPRKVTRVVIDIRANDLVMMYVNEIPGGALLEILPLMNSEES